MTDADLNREIAAKTGETVSIIREMGFGIADPEFVEHDPEVPCDVEEKIVDWDDLAEQRAVPFPQSFVPAVA